MTLISAIIALYTKIGKDEGLRDLIATRINLSNIGMN